MSDKEGKKEKRKTNLDTQTYYNIGFEDFELPKEVKGQYDNCNTKTGKGKVKKGNTKEDVRINDNDHDFDDFSGVEVGRGTHYSQTLPQRFRLQ